MSHWPELDPWLYKLQGRVGGKLYIFTYEDIHKYSASREREIKKEKGS
jgi:hypothetical protein